MIVMQLILSVITFTFSPRSKLANKEELKETGVRQRRNQQVISNSPEPTTQTEAAVKPAAPPTMAVTVSISLHSSLT